MAAGLRPSDVLGKTVSLLPHSAEDSESARKVAFQQGTSKRKHRDARLSVLHTSIFKPVKGGISSLSKSTNRFGEKSKQVLAAMLKAKKQGIHRAFLADSMDASVTSPSTSASAPSYEISRKDGSSLSASHVKSHVRSLIDSHVSDVELSDDADAMADTVAAEDRSQPTDGGEISGDPSIKPSITVAEPKTPPQPVRLKSAADLLGNAGLDHEETDPKPPKPADDEDQPSEPSDSEGSSSAGPAGGGAPRQGQSTLAALASYHSGSSDNEASD
eukprot:Rmarinus@m.3886